MQVTHGARPIGILMAIALCAVDVAITAAPASADTNDVVTAGEISQALAATDELNGQLVGEPVRSQTDVDSAAVVVQGDMTVDVAKTPEGGVSFASEAAPPITVGLPNANEAKDAQRLADGTVVYASVDGSANAVIPTEGGVQMLTTIANRDAPTTYDYSVELPPGGHIELEAGGAVVLDEVGSPVLLVAAPWAKDANGDAVPTRFETDGTTLTQVVEHTAGNFTYPVVADPWWFAAILGAVGACARGAAQSLIWAGAKQAILRGDWYWNQRLWDAADSCLQGLVFGPAFTWAIPWALKRWTINALKPHVYNVIRWTVLR